MKKLLLILLLATFIIPYSCTKRYKEDPFTMHFVRMRKRINGEWHMKKILIDGHDFTHLIYTDTVPFYSIYVFSGYRRTLHTGDVILKTYDGKYETQFKDVTYVLSDIKNINAINYIYFGQDPTILVLSYGAINNFIGYSAPGWAILKLTKKEMHLQTTYNSQEYDIYFEKK